VDSLQNLLKGLLAGVHSIEDRMDLRQQIAVATGVLCFLTVAILAIGAAEVGRREAMAATSMTLTEIATTVADRLDRNIANRIAIAEQFASLESLATLWKGPPGELRKALARTRAAATDTTWVGFATADGIVRAATDRSREGASVAGMAWFTNGLSRSTVADAAQTADSEGAADDATLPRFADLGVPVRAGDGEVIGVVGVYIGTGIVDRLRDSTVGSHDPQNSIEIGVVRASPPAGDSQQEVALSDEERARMLAAENGALPALDADGRLTAFSVSNGDGSPGRPAWLVVVRQSAAIAFRAADRVVTAIIALGLVVAAVGIAGAFLIAGRVSRPFRKLADRAALIDRDSKETLPRVRGSLEAVRLSAALRALVLRMGHAEQSSAETEERAAEQESRLKRDIAALKSLADTDTLTELYNRRALMAFASAAFDGFRVDDAPCAVLMIDIDHFKRINDAFGHAAGDSVIRAVASSIAASLRAGDRAARFGGEEFVVLLADVSLDQALEAAERVRTIISGAAIRVGEDDLAVTVSVGVAVSNRGDRNAETLVERADIALYAAKNAGRNRVVLAPAAIDRRHVANG
jgi:diguanylate cyclase (GGDEF)-like protein